MRDAERHRVGNQRVVGVQRQTDALMLCGMQRKRRKRIDLHGIKSGAGEVLKRAQSGANGVVIAFQRQRAGGGFIAVLQVLCELGNQMLGRASSCWLSMRTSRARKSSATEE